MTQPKRILITAGPTHEPIDAVRYLANRSSGRMGVALANEAAQRGYAITLLLGPIDSEALPHHSQIRLLRFRTAANLQELLENEWPDHDLLIMAAAVADFRPATTSPDQHHQKLDRRDGPITLMLEPVPDLLQQLARISRPNQQKIGFALEPADRLDTSARAKLQRKDLDAIIANPLETMNAPDIAGRLYLRDGRILTPPADRLDKPAFARWLLDQLDLPDALG